MNWPLRIVGVGSPHGDDALAWAVIERLRAALGAQPDVELHCVDGGQRLLDLLDGTGTLFLIDALSGVGPVGSIQRFTWPDGRLASLRSGSTHDLGAAQALHLAEALGSLPKLVVIYGIVAEAFHPQTPLSPKVAAAVHVLTQKLAVQLTAVSSTEAGSSEQTPPWR